ncbi:hypothetical protein ACN28I_15665 [Archangium gephyra]|uniref:hypothetical protein n=1 Tax=Archangium gephyra TaxID=48 RepID=UPI003B7E4668
MGTGNLAVTPGPAADSPRRVLATGALLALGTLLFRLPVFLNAEALDSDIAVVGLQAWHLARGEFSPLLWGTNYQGITAPLAVLLVETLLPVRPSLALALSSVLGHVVLVLALFGVLRRVLPLPLAALGAGSVAVCPEPLNFLTYSAFRIWAFTLVFLGLYLAERAAGTARPWRRLLLAALAGLAVGLGYYSDLFVLQLLPGLVLYLLWWTWGVARPRWLALGAALAGYGVGSIPRLLAAMQPPQLSELTTAHLPRVWPLFWEKCLPYLTGAKLFASATGFDRPELRPEGLALLLVVLGLGAFLLLVLGGGVIALLPVADRTARRLAWCGAGWMGVSIIGFLFTHRAMDLMSARYLVPVLLGFPLVAAPVLDRLVRTGRTKLAVVLLGVGVAHFGVAGWLGYGGWLEGGLPTVTRYGSGEDERALLAALQARGVEAATGDYWVAYRLTYLWREQLVVPPSSGVERYRPYRQRLASARRTALIFFPHIPGSPFRVPEPWEARFRREGRRFERLTMGPYTALVLD